MSKSTLTWPFWPRPTTETTPEGLVDGSDNIPNVLAFSPFGDGQWSIIPACSARIQDRYTHWCPQPPKPNAPHAIPYGEQVKLLRTQHYESLVQLAAEVRRDIVVPFCDRFKCNFHSQAGMFWVKDVVEDDVYNYDTVTKQIAWCRPRGDDDDYAVDEYADVMHHLIKLFCVVTM